MRGNSITRLRRSALFVAATLTLVIEAGCSHGGSAPPLDDVEVGTVTRASVDDIARYINAMLPVYKAQFGGAGSYDAQGNLQWKYERDEFDAYWAEHERERLNSALTYRPFIRISLRTDRLLFDREALRTEGVFYLCDSETWLHESVLMWRGRIVDSNTTMDIEDARRAELTSQEYEIFLLYTYSDRDDAQAPRTPLPRDVCFHLARRAHTFFIEFGRPVRIPAGLINSAAGF